VLSRHFGTRALFDPMERNRRSSSLVWSHFLRRTGIHFVGKCSRQTRTQIRKARAPLLTRFVAATPTPCSLAADVWRMLLAARPQSGCVERKSSRLAPLWDNLSWACHGARWELQECALRAGMEAAHLGEC